MVGLNIDIHKYTSSCHADNYDTLWIYIYNIL